MEKNRKAVMRLANQLHEMRDEIEEDLDILVDKDLVEEMKRMGILEGSA
jgi:hypothetical protein